MKLSRDFLLLSSVVGLLAAGVVLYWSHQQVEHLTAASLEFSQARTTRRAALQDATIRLGHLQARLVETQDDNRIAPGYDEWSRQQAEARAAVAAIRQHFAELEPNPVSPLPAQPALTASAAHLRELGSRLLAGWRDFEQQGSGLTARSRDLAHTSLLPLIADEIKPAIAEVTAADASDAEHRSAAFPSLISPARRIRAASLVGLVAFFGLLISSLVPRRKAPAKLLSAAWQKSATASDSVPPMPVNFEHNVAALDRTLPKILVAEQNAAESDTISLLLNNAGFAVIGCDNGAVARDALQRFQFALLLLDLRLPVHGGLEILREARRQRSDLPAILLCDAQEDLRSIEEAIASGPTQIVRRPLNPRMLLWNVSETLFPGENRQPREYSPYVPDADDEPEQTAAAEPAAPAEIPPPPPVRPPEPPPAAPAPVATASSAMRLSTRRLAPPPAPAPVAPAPVEPPPPPPVKEPEIASLPVAPEPPPPPPAPPAPEAVPTATEVASTGDGPPVVRKKMVRRRIAPGEGT